MIVELVDPENLPPCTLPLLAFKISLPNRHRDPIKQPASYSIDPDEIDEDEDLLLDGEMPSRADSGINASSSDSDSDEDLPVRSLTNFTFYDIHSMRLYPVTSDVKLGCSGEISVKLENEYDDDDSPDNDDDLEEHEERRKVKLSQILETWLDPSYLDA